LTYPEDCRPGQNPAGINLPKVEDALDTTNISPVPSELSEVRGIVQSDLLIITALREGFKRLRANPWLFDYIFASLRQDPLFKPYQKSIEKARERFLKTDIPVFMSIQNNEAKMPCVTIELKESVEAEATMSDLHYVTKETTEGEWPVLAGPISPDSYDPVEGILVFPASISDSVLLTEGMLVIDKVGADHPILEVIDNQTVRLTAGLVADFTGALIKGQKPLFITSLESLVFRETYQIGCHYNGHESDLIDLYSIVMFILLRYKEELLEGRGFERSTIAAQGLMRNPAFPAENSYFRAINLQGYVRQYWPKNISYSLNGVSYQMGVGRRESPGEVFVAPDGSNPTDFDSWLADQDPLSVSGLLVE
jgi:hypothetical protein